jgi:uncharacterized OB-fold protein
LEEVTFMGIYEDKRKRTHTPEGYELLTQESGHLEYDFHWHMGYYWSKYLTELRDNKRFMGVKCPECGTVYNPPRANCGKCYVEMNEWVELADEGMLEGFTIVRFPYIDPNNGGWKVVPFTSIWVTLDGADTRMMHFCNEYDEKDLDVGMRMRAVWNEERTGSIHDVKYFEVVKEAKPAAKKAAAKKPAKKAAAKKAAKKPAKPPRKPAKKAAAKKAAKKPAKKAAKK